MRVGSLQVDPGILLAPMEAVTDLPFRTVCEELGAALTFTEFLSAEALTRGARKAVDRMWPSLEGRRFAVQIFGREPAALARAAEMAVDVGASIVDINMGCPAKKVTAGMCGSALMREPELAAALVDAVRRAVPAEIPVTVKHRAGWDECSVNAPEFARRLVDVGAAMITVHGRTRAQGFSGQVQLAPIAAVRRALPPAIPVIGNGDVKDVAAFYRMKEVTGCDGVMIGRGAMGNPWLFRSLAALSRGEADPGPPTLVERRRVWRRHAELCVAHAHEKMRVHELRKTLAWYSRGLWGGSQLRQKSGGTNEPWNCWTSARAFSDLVTSGRSAEAEEGGHHNIFTTPADPVSKSIARNVRRGPDPYEAPETSAVIQSKEGKVASLLWLLLLLLPALGSAACEESSHRDVQDEINIVTRRNDALVPPAIERLGRYGRVAIPQVETAMHTAAPRGRLHLVTALEQTGDEEAIPVLRHCAVYDVRSDVRDACAEVLANWAAAGSAELPAARPTGDARGASVSVQARRRAERAGLAQLEIARKHQIGEGPLIFDDGTPGAPTVGAPEPVGSDLEKTR